MNAAKQIRVCVIDDHAVLRDGLRLLIDAEADMSVVGESDSGASAAELVRRHQPDVLVIDISMPGGSGLNAVPQVTSQPSAPRVVVLSVHEEQGYVRRVLAAGALAYVLKRSAATELIEAIRRAANGSTHIDPILWSRIVVKQRVRPRGSSPEQLTEREIEVVSLMARGYGNSEIADRLGISVKTVETHRTRIMARMGFRSRADLVRYALAEGLLTPSDQDQ
jgi:DNA-binding NarL/FixJ family response regulator